MKEFLKFTLASMVGFIVANIILLVITITFLFIGIGSVATMTKGFQSGQQAKIEEKSILKIGLDQPIVERTSDDPFKDVMYTLQDQPKPIAISDVLQSIEHAKTDDKIKGVFLDLSVVPASRATVKGIYNKLKSYKSSGKFIYAYGDMMTQQSYYLASLADSIYLQPEGMFMFNGMHSEMTFYKGLFDKLEIEPNVIKMGKYKSAGESFSHKEMTDANREQMNELLNTFYHTHLEAISESRDIKVSRLKTIADSLMVRNAEDAVEHGFVDQLAYRDEVLNMLKEKSGIKEGEDLNTVGLQKYSKKADDWGQNTADSEIAVIYATGPIGLKGGDSENIGSKRMSEAIRSARKNEDVKAVVLRVNSPGGSALASDVIWREVKLTKAEKPIIVSMGDLAASGGYYVSASADTIVAQPNTITGSIGVIGILMNWQKFFNEKLGVTFDRVKTAKYADLGNPNRPMMEKEKEIMRTFIRDIYDDFLSKVAQGRGMPVNKVDSLARGRVWSGEDAKEVGLVDEIGGIEKAINIAASKADLEEYDIKYLPEQKGPFDQFLKNFGADIKQSMVKSELGENYKHFQRLKELKNMESGAYAILPYELRIK